MALRRSKVGRAGEGTTVALQDKWTRWEAACRTTTDLWLAVKNVARGGSNWDGQVGGPINATVRGLLGARREE
jgi:hypothetical protein